MRGRAYLNPSEFFHKLRVQGFRCSDCKEPFTDESNRRIEDLWNKGEEIEINGEAYNLVYKRKRNEGGKNEPDNIKITCSKCQITTKIVTARLPIMLVERMDKVIEYENSHGNRKRRYGRSDFVKDSIEATLSYKKVDWPGKIASTKGNMGIFSSHVKAALVESRQQIKAAHESGVLIEINKILENLNSSDSSELDSKNQEQNIDYSDEKLNALFERLEDEQKQREAILMENLERMEILSSMAAKLENWKEELSTIDYPLDEVISADEDKDE